MPGNTYSIGPFKRVSAFSPAFWDATPGLSGTVNVVDDRNENNWPTLPDPQWEWRMTAILPDPAASEPDAALQKVIVGQTSGTALDYSNVPVQTLPIAFSNNEPQIDQPTVVRGWDLAGNDLAGTAAAQMVYALRRRTSTGEVYYYAYAQNLGWFHRYAYGPTAQYQPNIPVTNRLTISEWSFTFAGTPVGPVEFKPIFTATTLFGGRFYVVVNGTDVYDELWAAGTNAPTVNVPASSFTANSAITFQVGALTDTPQQVVEGQEVRVKDLGGTGVDVYNITTRNTTPLGWIDGETFNVVDP